MLNRHALRLTVVLLALFSYAAPAHSQQCLHGPNEDATQKARRQAALKLVRAINAGESKYLMMSDSDRYSPLSGLTIEPKKVEGFAIQFTMDGAGYSLILKDTTDPCHFVYSTNQNGVTYGGYPVDFEVLPIVRDTAKK